LEDFDNEYPNFDWKNTPAYKHPGGRNCPCPKHEYIREQMGVADQVNKSGGSGRITLKFCPDHHRVYKEEVIPSMPFKYRIPAKFALKIGAIKIQVLDYMQSDLCFYCKFGSGGFDKKNEIGPIDL
jgi:hypothetical protein